jgi:hypothetical protein
VKLKEFFEAVVYCLAHGIMEYWNVGILILKRSFSFIDFLVNRVLSINQNSVSQNPIFHCSIVPAFQL